MKRDGAWGWLRWRGGWGASAVRCGLGACWPSAVPGPAGRGGRQLRAASWCWGGMRVTGHFRPACLWGCPAIGAHAMQCALMNDDMGRLLLGRARTLPWHRRVALPPSWVWHGAAAMPHRTWRARRATGGGQIQPGMPTSSCSHARTPPRLPLLLQRSGQQAAAGGAAAEAAAAAAWAARGVAAAAVGRAAGEGVVRAAAAAALAAADAPAPQFCALFSTAPSAARTDLAFLTASTLLLTTVRSQQRCSSTNKPRGEGPGPARSSMGWKRREAVEHGEE